MELFNRNNRLHTDALEEILEIKEKINTTIYKK